MNKTLITILLVFTMLFWAINFHVVKIALEFYSPLPVAAFRFLFTAMVMIPIAYYQGKKNVHKSKYTWREKWFIFLTSFFGIFLTIYFFNKGLQTGKAVNGSLIISTSPLITAILAFFMMNRRLTPVQIFAILVSFIGVATILAKGQIFQILNIQFEQGDLFIVCMAMVFSMSQIIVAKYIPHIDSIQLTKNAAIIAFGLFVLFSFSEIIAQPIPVSFRFWASIIFMGIFGTGIGYTIFYLSIVKLGASKTTLFMNLIPLFAVLTAYPFGEKVYPSQLLGGAIVITGLILFNVSKKNVSLKKSD